MTDIGYFLFDVESVADGELIAKVRYPNEGLSAAEAISAYRAERLEQTGSDFIPYTHQLPVSVVIAKVKHDLSLVDIVTLDGPEYRPHVITQHFWLGWQRYGKPTLVTFNGRGFDVPLLEMAAFRYGISIPEWFAGKSAYDKPRNRFNTSAHLDLQELLTNYGASRFNGGLNLAAMTLGKPGKMEVQGDMVQDLYDQGRLAEINEYCKCDVLDTYFVFLRCKVLMGELTLEEEIDLVDAAKSWLEQQAGDSDAYATYLAQWQDWTNPWKESKVSDQG